MECHAAPKGKVDAAVYTDSPHGLLSCERCHAEATGPAHESDPEKPLSVPAGRHGLAAYSARCVKCHATASGSYAKSFHGIAVRMGDLRAATCVDCHGVHGVFSATDPRAATHTAKLAGTYGTAECHPGAPDSFAKGREHFDYTQKGEGTDQILYWIWKFFIALILFDVMKDGPIVMFELLRRIRG